MTMLFNWLDYSGNDDEATLPLLISVRTQQLVLAAITSMEFRHSWLDTDDATFDDIDAAIGEAYKEIIAEASMAGTFHGVRAWRDTNYQSTSATLWQPIEFNQISATADYAHGAGSTNYLEAPETGWYLVTGGVVFNSNSSGDAFHRQARIVNHSGSVLCFASGSFTDRIIGLQMATLWQMAAGEFLQLEILTNIPNLLILSQPQNSPVLTMERVR